VQLTAAVDSVGVVVAVDNVSDETAVALVTVLSDGAVGVDVPQATTGKAIATAMIKRPVRGMFFLLVGNCRSVGWRSVDVTRSKTRSFTGGK
jgi:hypothetical protein